MCRLRHREMMTRHLRKQMKAAGKWDDFLESASKNSPVAKYLLKREKKLTPNLKLVVPEVKEEKT